MQNTILICDGHNLLFQMFYGMPSRILGPNGKPIQGVIGFVGALNKLIKMVNPTHVIVLFDSEQVNPRSEEYADYKKNRLDYSLVEEIDNPFSQLNDIYKALDYMRILHMEIVGYEADDAIASYCKQYEKNNLIYISSFDSDLFQLINDCVKVIRYRGKASIIYDKNLFSEKYQIHPNYYVDYKSLVGDPSDNIKGVYGIGAKTAAYLINNFKTIDNLYNNINDIDKEKVKKSLLEAKDVVYRNYSLISLKTNVPLPFTLKEIEYNKIIYKTMDVIKNIY